MFNKLILAGVLSILSPMVFADVQTQNYEITIENNWNLKDHLGLPGNAHFSPVVAVSHDPGFDLLTFGGITRSSLEPLAELGQTTKVEAEIAKAMMDETVLESVVTENMFVPAQKTQKFEIMVSNKKAFVSLVSMIAPSPDWMIAVSNMKLFNENQGFFEGVTKLPLYAVDGGTEGGDTGGNFKLSNPATSPQTPVNILKGEGFKAPFAYLTIKKIEK